MRALYGVYRAVCLDVAVEAREVKCQIPQVFADETVLVLDINGGLPTAGDVGWVAFESGYPDRPVWMSTGGGGTPTTEVVYVTRDYLWSVSTTAADPGHGKVRTNNANPMLATQVYLSLYDSSGRSSLNILSLGAGNRLVLYANAAPAQRVEYTLTGALSNHGEWVTAVVAVTASDSFAPADLEVVVVAIEEAVTTTEGDEIFIGPDDPGTTYELWYDTDAIGSGSGGGGTGTDEVWIGPTAPIGSTLELWYDTDAVNLTDPDTARWNSAWGIVARATFLAGVSITSPANIGVRTNLTNPLTFTGVTGRRYRLVGRLRAVITNGLVVLEVSVDDGVATSNTAEGYATPPGNFFTMVAERFFDGDGTSHTFVMKIRSTEAATSYIDGVSSFCYIEDVGPVSMSAAPPNQPWSGVEAAKPVTPAAAGQHFFASDTKRDWLWDGTGWIIMAEPVQQSNVTAIIGPSGDAGLTSVTRYHRSDGWVDIESITTYGSGPTSTGSVQWSATAVGLPAAAIPANALRVTFYDASAGGWYQGTNNEGTNTVGLFGHFPAGNNVGIIGLANGVPFAWTGSDRIIVSGRYRLASRYT